MNDSVNPNRIGDGSVASTRMTMRSTPPSLAPKTAQRASLGHRLQRALTGGPNPRFPGLPPSPGGAASLSPFLNRRLGFPILALLALLAASLLFLLPGGPLHAQDAAIQYAENGTGPVATYTAVDPEGADITSWTLAGDDADDFMIDGGVLSFAKSPDYEMRMGGSDRNSNTYSVTVQATDESNKVGMHEVTVEVTNVEEPGTVMLSALRPQSQTAFNATLTDPDGADSGLKWQWAKSSSRSGTYSDIEGAIASIYTPQDTDNGSYLRVTATYTDPEGSDKSAMATSANKVQAVRGDNNAPVFPDEDGDESTEISETGTTRTVAENTAAGQAIGDPVVAEDEDGDILTYTLTDADGGTDGDSDSFAIDWATGQLMTKGALDFETGTSHTVTVRATDPEGEPQVSPAVDMNSDEITVIITVTNVNEPPAVAGPAAVTVLEGTDGIANALMVEYTANDPETTEQANDSDVTWSVAGDDGSEFEINNVGELTFEATPDFEAPTDANKNNVYEVTVRAADGDGNRGEMAVKVTVANVEESGTVSLSRTQIRVGVPVTASLSDPDGSISGLSWQWYNGAVNDENAIGDANSDTYTPVADDGILTAVASYTDGHGPDKSEEGAASSMVAEDTRNRAPVFEDQDVETDGDQNESTTRKVTENTKALAGSDDDDAADATDGAGDNVGSVITATDPDPNTEDLIYTLDGADADKFRVRSNGQIEVGAGTKLDYEIKDTYMVTVIAEDSFGESASIMVTINVTDMDEAPDVTGDDMAEYAENGTGPVATYTAVDPEGADITSWTLAGDDADDFMIDGGVLSFAKSPDYEMRMGGSDRNSNTYSVTVQATDESNKVGMHEVTVEVTNVEEPGTVMLSALRPQSQTAFNATLTDPDGADSGLKWQWAKSSSRSGTYSDIEGAIASIYTPQDTDNGSYLRVTATYTDPEGSDKSAMATSANKVQAVRGDNNAPVFPDEDGDESTEISETGTTRTVAENTAAGQAIGDPVVAEDEDGDILTYTLTDADGGTDGDSDSFAIDWATGQLMTKGALDFETGTSHTVTVRATDPEGEPQVSPAVDMNSDEITVIITVTNVNEPPAVAGPAAVTVLEGTDGIANALMVEYTANDPETTEQANDSDVTWSVAGDDGSEFEINNVGELTFEATPDFEAPTDANKNNVYEVTVRAADGDGNRGEMAVKVTVANVEESGTVSLSRTQIRVGVPVTASLSDPDGSISGLSWQWYNGAVNDENAIGDANSDTYTPVADDGILTAVASYTDGHGPDKSEEGAASSMVAEDTRNRAPVFEDQDVETDGDQNESTTRKVTENTKALAGSDDDDAADATDGAGDNVGSVITATDPDPNTEDLIYTLDGADADKFRVRSNGQIEVGAGTKLDYEIKDTYMVTVIAEDSFGESASIMVTINVTDVDEEPTIRRVASSENQPPVFPSDTATRSVVEGTAAGADIGAPVTAEDPDVGDALTYTLGGANAASFDIVSATGQLQTKADLDYETKASYAVTVTATDDDDASDSIDVAITVTDVDENQPPAFDADTATRSVDENTAAGENIGGPVMAADDDTLTYTLSGTDESSFVIDESTGQLMTMANLDYETKTTYIVTVTATDTSEATDSVIVTITVTNVDEDGTVTLSPMQPVVDSEITASLDDPDGGVSDTTWQWASSDAMDGTYTNIAGATLDSYTPVEADENMYLQATVMYTDGHGSSKSEMAVSANAVNTVPAFDADTATRSVDENTAAGENIGGPVMAADDDTLTYTLSGTDESSFVIDESTGQLMTMANLDYETKTTYIVTVTATDTSEATDSVIVTITVTNVDEDGTVTLSPMQPVVDSEITASLDDPDGGVSDTTWQWASSDAMDGTYTNIAGATLDSYTPVEADENMYLQATVMYTDGHGSSKSEMAVSANAVNTVPAFDADTATRSVDENTAAGENIGGPVMAADDDTLTYTLSGTDESSFVIDESTGQLMTMANLDYETKTTYIVTVTATDTSEATDSVIVTITVTNVDEDGTVTLSSETKVGVAITATLVDVDGGTTGTTWQWASSDAIDGTYTNIAGATLESYTPVEADENMYLRATAMYTDGHGSGKSESMVSANAVIPTTGNPVADEYDANEDGKIDRGEVGQAVRDFIGRQIEHDDVLQIIAQYFKDLRSGS